MQLCRACGILVPRPGVEPVPPAAEAWSLNHWTVREGPEPVSGTTALCGAFPQQGKTQSLRAWGAGHHHLWCSHYRKGSTWQEGGRQQEEVGCPALRPALTAHLRPGPAQPVLRTDTHVAWPAASTDVTSLCQH